MRAGVIVVLSHTGQLSSQLLVALAISLDANASQHRVKLILVLDAVIGRLAAAVLEQRVRQVLGVSGVRCRPTGDAARQAARHNDIRRSPADAVLGTGDTKWIDAARPLQAVPAAQARLAKTTLRQLSLITIPAERHAGCPGFFDHENRIRAN
jgi:hypothetical protein